MNSDFPHMHHALRLAGRALGRVAPNPAVGCVIVKDGHILGRGWTQPGGRPHAETEALKQAADSARGSTAYVTLEPCAHHGQTPPCANALIAAGVSRVVIAVQDPDPRVSGRGIAMLRDAGIEVTTGILEKEAAELNKGFFLKVKENRPLVTLKIAQSRDGLTASNETRWITGEEAREFGHLLRAKYDAILIGVETALDDDPQLTCRIPGLEDRSPIRVVLDTRLRLPVASKLAQTARQIPTLVFTTAEGGEALTDAGVEIIRVSPDAQRRPDISACLNALAGRGITRLLVEGGATIHAAFLDRGLADRLEIFTAPAALGAAGHGGIAALAALTREEAPKFERITSRHLGPDLLESFAAKA